MMACMNSGALRQKLITLESGIMALLLLFLLALYGITLTALRVEAPSEEISREIPLATLEYGFSRTNNTHVQTLPVPGSPAVRIIAVNGTKTKILKINIKGEILAETDWDLNLSQASRLKAYHTGPDHVRLFYQHRGLHQTDLRLSDRSIRTRILSRDVRDFCSTPSFVVFSRDDGLYGLKTDGSEAPAPSPVRLVSGPAASFRAVQEAEGFVVLFSGAGTGKQGSLRLAWFDGALDLQRQVSIPLGESAKFYRRIEDLHWEDNTLSALFLYVDSRSRIHHISLRNFDGFTGESLQESRHPLPFYKSRYRIVGGGRDGVRFIHQIEDPSGVDLGLTTVLPDGSHESQRYTKTRSMSKLGGYFREGEREGLVFSDINYDTRALLFASSDPFLMESTTKMSSIGFWYPVGTTVVIFFVSLVMGWLYLLALSPLPVLWSLGIDKFLFPRGRLRQHMFTLSLLVLHTVLKLLISKNLIHGNLGLLFSPRFFLRTPLLYGSFILTSLISYALTLRANRRISYENASSLDFYIRFAVYDYIQYTAVFLMYICSSVLLAKI